MSDLNPVPVRAMYRSEELLAECEKRHAEHRKRQPKWVRAMKENGRSVWGRRDANVGRDASNQIIKNFDDALMAAQEACATARAILERHPELADKPVYVKDTDNGACGWVYFAIREGDGAVKIGYSYNPSLRLKQFSSGSGPCHLAAEMPGTVKDEKALHRRFAHRCVGGEWFAPNDALMDIIRKWPIF